jgi:hypothetical protein
MLLNFTAKINHHFHNELIEKLVHQTGISSDKIRVPIQFSILATLYQVKFRLQQQYGMLLTYRMAKVAAGSEVPRHLLAIFNKQGHNQGIINMTTVLYNGDFSKIEKMLVDRFGLSEDVANRILIMSTCSAISILGETIREKKLRMEGFREMINHKLPLYREELSSVVNFPFEHWDSKAAELQNQLFRTDNRKKRSTEKKSRFSLPFKWLFILLVSASVFSFVYAYT